MKIAGITYYDGKPQLYLKPDTALLVNRKPFFLPHFTEEVTARPCIAARISRMGRCIEARFAERYYTETAPAINFQALAVLQQGDIDSITRALAFDNSFAVGIFSASAAETEWQYNHTAVTTNGWVECMNEAVAQVSRYITLRTGDMVAVDLRCEPLALKREDVISAVVAGEEVLYCKIK